MTQVSVVWTKRTIGNSCLEYVEVSILCIGVHGTCMHRCILQYAEVSVVAEGSILCIGFLGMQGCP